MSAESQGAPDDSLRVGHAERQQVADLLGASMSRGYLTLDEFEERVSAAHAATVRGELRALLADLPAADALRFDARRLACTAVARPDSQVLRASMEATLVRRGDWRVSPKLTLTGAMSMLKLDLSEADIPIGGVDIDVRATWSTIKLTLAPSMRLVTDEFTTSAFITLKDRAGPPTESNGVTVNVRGRPSMSTVVIRRAKR